MKKYFIVINNNVKGPLNFEELEKYHLSEHTLIWTEGMDDWQQLKNVEELKDKTNISISPPPLPNNKKSSATKIEKAIANEVKQIFKFILCGILITAISYPIYYFGIYKVNKYNGIKNSAYGDSDSGNITVSFSKFQPEDFDRPINVTAQTAEELRSIYKEQQSEKTLNSTIYTFLTLTVGLIIIKYLHKGIKWVQNASD